MSLLNVKGSIKVTIPKEIVETLNLKPKQIVLVSLSDEKIIIELIDGHNPSPKTK